MHLKEVFNTTLPCALLVPSLEKGRKPKERRVGVTKVVIETLLFVIT